MPGLRIHLTGSAAKECEAALLANAHDFARCLSARLIADGQGLLTGVGGEPIGDAELPCIFDWTALEVIAEAQDQCSDWPQGLPARFVAVASQSGLGRIPGDRQAAWESCLGRPDFKLDPTPPGWRMAGLIRDRQLLHGDVLVALGGGAGAELLAQQYREDGKPVIAIDTELGAFNKDGNGGSRYLYGKALSESDTFFQLRAGAGDGASRLSALQLTVDTDPEVLAAAVAGLVGDLRPRPAFYVRLLDTDQAEFAAVETFFRDVVDPVVEAHGFRPNEIGMHRPETAFMDVEIFKLLHYSSLVVVDLTAVRPNCMMELGYALGRRRRCLISAMKGTSLPFDPNHLPTYFWDPADQVEEMIKAFGEWVGQYSELPPLVA
jgi:hypothetical protein